MHVLNDIKITAKTREVLSKLRTNLIAHKEIVEEAQVGYRAKIIEFYESRLAEAKAGKRPDTSEHVFPPQDHSDVYETAIAMLELATDEFLELNSTQVRHLVQDEWDWKDQWLAANSGYSVSAAQGARTKGLI